MRALLTVAALWCLALSGCAGEPEREEPLETFTTTATWQPTWSDSIDTDDPMAPPVRTHTARPPITSTPTPGPEPTVWNESFPRFAVLPPANEDAARMEPHIALRHWSGPCIDPRQFTWTIVQGDVESVAYAYPMSDNGEIVLKAMESWCPKQNAVLGPKEEGWQAIELLVHNKTSGELVLRMHVQDALPEPWPILVFSTDQAARTLTVVEANPDHTWAEFDLSGCAVVPAPEDAVDPGDALEDCAGVVTVYHPGRDELVYKTTFS